MAKLAKETPAERKLRLASKWTPPTYTEPRREPQKIYNIRLSFEGKSLVRSFYRLKDAHDFRRYCGSLRVDFELFISMLQ